MEHVTSAAPYLCTKQKPANAGESEISTKPASDAAGGLADWLDRAIGGPVAAAGSVLTASISLLFLPVELVLDLAGFLGFPLLLAMRLIFPHVSGAAAAIQLDPVVVTSMVVLLIVRTALVPATLGARRASVRLAAYRPMLLELQHIHASDPKALQTATMQLYADKNINPFGCIGWLIPTVVLLVAFFGVVEKLAVRSDTGTFAPVGVPDTSALAEHMMGLPYFTSWQMDLTKPLSVTGLCDETLPYVALLAALVTISAFSTWQMRAMPHAIAVGIVFASITLLVAVTLPAFIVILRCVDGVFLGVQSVLLNRYQRGYIDRLRLDPDIQRQLAETYVDVGAIVRRAP